MNKTGYWPSTPNTNLIYGLDEACDMLLDPRHGGLPATFARHLRWAEGVRAAVRAWGLEVLCLDGAVYSPILTGVVTPVGVDADQFVKLFMSVLIARWVPVWANSRVACSALAIWAIAMTSP